MAKYIDANKLLPKVKYREKTYGVVSNRFSKLVKEMPAADVQEVKHGAWERDEYDMLCCSQCKEELAFEETTPYCPYCGAKMDGNG